MRGPHIVMAAIWFVWYANVCTAIMLPDRALYGLVVLLAFVPLEAVGVFRDTGLRDTLSEIVTWVQRRLSKHRRFIRGWNALILMVVLTIAYLLSRTIQSYTGSYVIATVIGGLTVIWLYDHWMDPQEHG